MSDSQSNELDVIHRFLERICDDRARGVAAPLSKYQAEFPGHEHVIAAEYATLFDESAQPARDRETQRVGPYEIISELGRGGQGVVYLANDTRLPRQVALKVLRDHAPWADDQRLIRFRREAELVARLDHPSICRIIDVGHDGNSSYLAMSFVPGRTLARELDERRRAMIDPSTRRERDGRGPQSDRGRRMVLDAVVLVQKCAEAVHAAHEAGIVHRDLKPGNVMITPEGDPVILDFGLAREDDDAAEVLTGSGDRLGTPAYMAPEQVRGEHVRVDRRTDVHALGVLLYECVTLERPFRSPTLEGLYQSILISSPPDPRAANPEVPADLKVVLDVALEKDPARRYQSAQDLAEDLRRVRASEPILAKPPSFVGRMVRWSRRRPAAAALVAALTLTIPAIAALAGWISANLPMLREQEREELERRVEAWLERGHAELAEGDPTAALAAFQEARELRPGSEEAIAGEALAHIRAGAPESAIALLESAAGDSVSGSGLGQIRVEALRAAGREAEATALAARLPEARDALGFFMLAARHVSEGHRRSDRLVWEKARDALENAIRTTRQARPLYVYELAHVAGHLGDDATARRAVRSLEALWPDRTDGWFWAGIALMDVDHPGAEAAFRRYVERKPDDARALSNLGRVICNQGRLEEGEQVFRQALRVRPGESELHHDLGYALYLQNRFSDAAAEYRLAADGDPDNPEHWSEVGETLLLADDTLGALEALGRARKLAPGDHARVRRWYDVAVGWLRTARAHIDHGEAGGSAEVLRQWLRDESLRTLGDFPTGTEAPTIEEWERFWKSVEAMAARAGGGN